MAKSSAQRTKRIVIDFVVQGSSAMV